MITRRLFLFGILFLILALVSNGLARNRKFPRQMMSQNVNVESASTYIIQPGDTLGKIAVQYGVSIASLLSINPQAQNPSLIYAGQVINLPAQPTFTKIEAEWPTKIDIDASETIRLTLFPNATETITPTAEVSGHATIDIASVSVGGTPAVSLKDAFGSAYKVCATVNLEGAAFDVKPLEIGCKPLDQDSITWSWSITPKSDGLHDILASVWFRWEPTGIEGQPIEKQIWYESFDTTVETPFIQRGQLNIAALISGLIGSALSIPWIYEKIIVEKKRAGRKKQRRVLRK